MSAFWPADCTSGSHTLNPTPPADGVRRVRRGTATLTLSRPTLLIPGESGNWSKGSWAQLGRVGGCSRTEHGQLRRLSVPTINPCFKNLAFDAGYSLADVGTRSRIKNSSACSRPRTMTLSPRAIPMAASWSERSIGRSAKAHQQSQDSRPVRAGSPLAGRDSHPLDSTRCVMKASHPPIPLGQQGQVELLVLFLPRAFFALPFASLVPQPIWKLGLL